MDWLPTWERAKRSVLRTCVYDTLSLLTVSISGLEQYEFVEDSARVRL